MLDTQALSELWQLNEDAPIRDRFAAELLGDLTQQPGNAGAWLRQAVDRIQEVTGAERIFLFEAQGTTTRKANSPDGSAVELGPAIYTSDFEREAIASPEAKVPMALLIECLKGERPVWALDSLEASGDLNVHEDFLGKTRSFAVVPLVVRGQCYGVLYFEHRFQPLEISDETGERLLVLLRALALGQALQSLHDENLSLWGDVLQLRKSLKSMGYGRISAVPAPGTKGTPEPNDAKEIYSGDYSMIIGSSPLMSEIFKLLDRIRDSNAPVLINGESGTGKELIAIAVHNNSPRRKVSFISENCAALTETLLESELFGYAKGSFTGANRDHKGLFEQADGGTLFLDEVGDMSSNMQKKLLRAVQEGVIRRVGGREYIKVDVRIISATNKDLLAEVRKGKFREDLYYRLNVINVKLPPLRERREDIPELIQFFLSQICTESGVEKTVDPQALRLLSQHCWPGNIRELQNEMKRAFALSDSKIEATNLSDTVKRADGGISLSALEDELDKLTLKEAVERVERTLIRRALLDSHGNKSHVAKQLQIPKTSLYNKIAKYQLDDEIHEILY